MTIFLCDLDYRYFSSIVGLGAFLEAVEGMKFDYIASGHYAHVTHSSSDQEKVPSILSLSKDMVPSLLHLFSSFFFSLKSWFVVISLLGSPFVKHIMLVADTIMPCGSNWILFEVYILHIVF